jgi:hypothetical protein
MDTKYDVNTCSCMNIAVALFCLRQWISYLSSGIFFWCTCNSPVGTYDRSVNNLSDKNKYMVFWMSHLTSLMKWKVPRIQSQWLKVRFVKMEVRGSSLNVYGHPSLIIPLPLHHIRISSQLDARDSTNQPALYHTFGASALILAGYRVRNLVTQWNTKVTFVEMHI